MLKFNQNSIKNIKGIPTFNNQILFSGFNLLIYESVCVFTGMDSKGSGRGDNVYNELLSLSEGYMFTSPHCVSLGVIAGILMLISSVLHRCPIYACCLFIG